MNVKNIMLSKNHFPVLNQNAIFKNALESMNNSRLGIVCLIDEKSKLIGLITDGDVRRKLLSNQRPLSAIMVDYAVKHSIVNPICCNENDTLESAVLLMGDKEVWDLPVLNDSKQLVGLLHLHNAVKTLLNI
jgi:arabinose-5-phosphate isomerase